MKEYISRINLEHNYTSLHNYKKVKKESEEKTKLIGIFEKYLESKNLLFDFLVFMESVKNEKKNTKKIF